MARSAIFWGLGDVGAQAITHYSTQQVCKEPAEEFHSYSCVCYPNTPLDGLNGTLNLSTFFPFMGLLQGRNMEQSKEDLKKGFNRVLVLGGAVLPAAHFINWRFVPAPYQLHCASLLALVGSCYLSWNDLEQHKDDARTQRIRKMERGRFDRTSLRWTEV